VNKLLTDRTISKKTFMKKILITGGHITPALSVMRELGKNGWECFYVGRKYALEGDKTISQEMRIIDDLGFKFVPITAGRLQRSFTKFTFLSLLKIPVGIIQAFSILIKNKPQIILSFGGYIGLPIAVAGWCLGIPIVIHEQTQSSGMANKIIGYFAKKICVSWSMSIDKFPKEKVIYTGLPLRKEIFQIKKQLNFQKTKPVIYITGGNLGSHSINLIIEEILPQLLTKYTVIHQCGNAKNSHDYKHLENFKNKLPRNLVNNYYLFTYINEDLIADIFKKADILISRSGANIVYEIIALSKPSILIPLPWSGMQEQLMNAKFLTDHQASIMIQQTELTGALLLEKIEYLFNNRELYLQNLEKLKPFYIKDADKRIAQVIESLE
jgi:UDP-N-acetylglucosamine--N-acetylmuramyl-(pentapeptide) pyrophosphoryl-undecaprenol N-acetylglucosamine transferase